MFRKVRAETEQKQQEAAALRRRRDEQRQARLIAARERQRARLGLPPISKDDIKLDDKSSELVDPSLTDVDKKSSEEGQTDDLQRKLMRAAHVRPWDVGKDGVKEPVMTQEEWLEKKRAERIEEFAPIPTKSHDKSYKIQYPKKKLFGRQKESLQAETSTSSTSVDITDDRRTTKSTISATKFSTRNEALYADTRRGLGVEIPPPDELLKQNQTGVKRKHVSLEETASAIEAGLKYLREEHEKTQNAPTRGAYNMI
ncbi:hypothetical protein O3M35_012841 [Rhynocoris fuscipes]|uniref:Uncharacterized protein n=1 Tax=Rhynocoris fuscipes TaxID=488301 RepID=A0AAW1CFP9_9HEMI